MYKLPLFLFLATIIAGLFAFSGAFTNYPIYSDLVTVAPYAFASFLFWMFMLLFLAAVIFNTSGSRRALSKSEQIRKGKRLKEQKDTIVIGFALALLLFLIAVISAIFGFGVVASTVAGLAVIVFCIDVGVGIVAVGMSLYDYRTNQHKG